MDVCESLADLVGNTPIVHLKRFGEGLENKILAKCEFMNPGGSIKDRIAFNMVSEAEKSGELKPGATIVEATAGNTGIGLALVAALKGYKLITVLSEKVSKDKVKMLESLGATVFVVPSVKDTDHPNHILNRAKTLAKKNNAWLSDQFCNQANIEAHYKTTAQEIWHQTDGSVDILVAGVGTGGTITGCGRFFKEKNPQIKIILADPVGSNLCNLVKGKNPTDGSYLVEGIGGDFIPENLDASVVDDVVQVEDDLSIQTVKDLFSKEAMFLGSSAGCIVAAAINYLKSNNLKNKTVVTILPDGGRSYMSTIYNPDWLKEKLTDKN